MKKKRDLILM